MLPFPVQDQVIFSLNNNIRNCLGRRITRPPLVNVSNMAGIHSSLSNVFAYEWIVASGASHHTTHCNDLLFDIKKLDNHLSDKVQVPTGGRCQITSAGNATIFGTSKIQNVIPFPDFKFNLLSVSKITKDLSCVVLFFPDFCVFQGLYNGKVLGIGREKDGLYFLKELATPTTNTVSFKHQAEGVLLHLLLGHPSSTVMHHIPSIPNMLTIIYKINVIFVLLLNIIDLASLLILVKHLLVLT